MNLTRSLLTLTCTCVFFASCTASKVEKASTDGPKVDGNPFPHQTGDAASGRKVFRFETFGNEGFWTDAMRLPKGMMDSKMTPVDALKAGLMVDAEALDPTLRDALAAELKTDLSPANAPLMNDPKTTLKLVNANAVVGVVAVDTNKDGKMTVEAGDKVGIACAICHTVTDKSVFAMEKGGSVGKRIDGPANTVINMGVLLATAANTRAYYPNMQAELGGKTTGRASKGLTRDSTEAEFDAQLRDPKNIPIGTFDDTSDGIGNSVANVPLFRTDLAAPWSSSAQNKTPDDIANGSYTINLDLTSLVTPEGRKFLHGKAGATGDELAENYAHILKATGVKGFPYVKAEMTGKIVPESPVGRRVANQKLLDMNAYTNSLQAPKGASVDAAASGRGRELFRQNCTTCHNVDQSKPVPPMIVDMKTIWPGYEPVVLANREAPMSPVQNAPGGFDDKMIVVDASDRGDKRGTPLPLLLDLASRPFFLHDASVPSLDNLLDPLRGEKSPHPFYIAKSAERSDVVEFLRGLDTESGSGKQARRGAHGSSLGLGTIGVRGR